MRLFIIVSVLFVSSCGLMQRSQQSGYSDPGYQSAQGNEAHQYEQRRTAYELGYDPNRTLSENQLKEIDDRRRLRILERRLESQKEKEQYSKILPWLTSDEERIEFLSIPTIEGRQAWINRNEIWRRAQSPHPAIREAVESNDIAMGMPQDLVRKAWGEPQDRFVSGNPLYKNERWKYTRYISTSDGYKKETRYVYFEAGKVVGWETE